MFLCGRNRFDIYEFSNKQVINTSVEDILKIEYIFFSAIFLTWSFIFHLLHYFAFILNIPNSGSVLQHCLVFLKNLTELTFFLAEHMKWLVPFLILALVQSYMQLLFLRWRLQLQFTCLMYYNIKLFFKYFVGLKI